MLATELAANVVSKLVLAKAVLPHMPERGRGTIVNMTSARHRLRDVEWRSTDLAVATLNGQTPRAQAVALDRDLHPDWAPPLYPLEP